MRQLAEPTRLRRHGPPPTARLAHRGQLTRPTKPRAFPATPRVVTLGGKQGDRVVVAAGLHDGDTVVTAGQIKLRSGASVVIDNRVQPPNEMAPEPPEE